MTYLIKAVKHGVIETGSLAGNKIETAVELYCELDGEGRLVVTLELPADDSQK